MLEEDRLEDFHKFFEIMFANLDKAAPRPIIRVIEGREIIIRHLESIEKGSEK